MQAGGMADTIGTRIAKGVQLALWLAGACWLAWLSLRPPVSLSDGASLQAGPDAVGLLLALACLGFLVWYGRYEKMFRTPIYLDYAWSNLTSWIVGGTLIAAAPDRVWTVLESFAGYDAANEIMRAVRPIGAVLLGLGVYAWLRSALMGARALRG